MTATASRGREYIRRPNARQETHCAHGHEWTPANTYLNVADNRRRCRACLLIQQATTRGVPVPDGYPTTACINGHQRTDSNTYVTAKGSYRCLTCKNVNMRNSRARVAASKLLREPASKPAKELAERMARVRAAKPVSILPPGWNRQTIRTPKANVDGGTYFPQEGMPLLKDTALEPGIVTACMAVLAYHGALDCADALGLAW